MIVEDKLNFLKEHFSSYEVKLSEDGKSAAIINPFGKENIEVRHVPEDDFTPYIVYFAFQHAHICDEENVIEYINEIIDGNVLSIEFFRNGARCFGGDISPEELKDLSYTALAQSMRAWGIMNLKDRADSFALRGWRDNHNFDGVFVVDEKGAVTIERRN